MRPLRLLLPLALGLAACSDPARNGGTSGDTGTNPAPDTGQVASDSGAEDGAGTDDANSGMDAAGADQGVPRDVGVPDVGPQPDGGLPAVCEELDLCCPTVPAQIQGQCTQAAASGDAMQCMRALGVAQQLGYCLGPQPDATVRDAGPLGPACSDYLACCPELGPLQARCETSAMAGNEATCQQALDLARMFGACLGGGDGGFPGFDGSIPDFGPLPFDGAIPDFGPFPDLGIPGFDAGPPPPGDAGAPD